jgi:hypothetical protein
MRNGIEDVKIRPVTGSLIICYDLDQIEEADILTWLKTLVETFLNMEIRSKSMNEADIRLRFACIRDWFSQNGTHNILIEGVLDDISNKKKALAGV